MQANTIKHIPQGLWVFIKRKGRLSRFDSCTYYIEQLLNVADEEKMVQLLADAQFIMYMYSGMEWRSGSHKSLTLGMCACVYSIYSMYKGEKCMVLLCTFIGFNLDR